jgi:hypothetical protein
MMNDLINATFEFIGALFIMNHCRVLYKDKVVRGVSIISNIYFGSWGVWNLFFYPSLGQTWSFYAGITLTLSNAIWIAMMYHYKNNGAKYV